MKWLEAEERKSMLPRRKTYRSMGVKSPRGGDLVAILAFASANFGDYADLTFE